MLAFRQFGVGCRVVNIAVKLVQGFHFHRVTTLRKLPIMEIMAGFIIKVWGVEVFNFLYILNGEVLN